MRTDPILRRTAVWSVRRAYLVSAATLPVLFAYAPIWVLVAGHGSLLYPRGQLQLSGMMMFLSTPLTAVFIAWCLRHGSRVGLSLPMAFIAAKVAILLVSAIVYASLLEGTLAGVEPFPVPTFDRMFAYLVVGLGLCLPFGMAYGLAFRAVLMAAFALHDGNGRRRASVPGASRSR